ncbi:MAG: hypothetical protein LLF75_05345 [Eubacteriales bacterium]|nr:hypothetical protein [Eubacteriales bacterium]
MKAIRIGWAKTDLTPDRPVWMIGQMYHRVSESVRDPITATALALENGEAQAVFVSLDMTEVPMHAMERLKARLSGLGDLNFENISFGVTHTHNASDFFQDFMRLDNESVFGEDILPELYFPDNVLRGEEAQTYLVEKLADLITRAWMQRMPGGVSAAHEYAAVSFSRRAVFARGDGEETVMYGDCSNDRFLRFEPGGDSAVELLYTWDLQGNLTGVAVNVPCPSQVFELHRFLSADYWGFVRGDVASALGEIYILPLCGAAGDLSPIDLVKISKSNQQELLLWGGQAQEVQRNFDMVRICEDLAARITEAVMRGYRQAKTEIDESPVLKHECLHLQLPLRLVSKEAYEASLAEVNRIQSEFSPEHRMTTQDVVCAFEPQGDVLRWRMQQETSVFPCVSHIVRIGAVALATNPFELFSEFAQRMKARALPEQLFVVQLSNGIGGYLPSRPAVAGGSYSSKPASTFCGPEGGDLLVEETLRAVNRMFEEQPGC